MSETDREQDDAPDDLVRRVEERRKEAEKHLSEWRDEAETCYGFVAGEQWTDDEKAYLEEQDRLPVVFNRVAPIVNAIRGQEVNNRTEVRYIPRRFGISGVDEIMTQAARYVRENCDAEDEDAEAFADVVICGIGVSEHRMDYEANPDGDIIIERKDPLTVRWDPSARKRNLRDRRWEQVDDWLTREEIEARWPDADLNSLTLESPEDGLIPHDATEAWKYENKNAGYNKATGKFRVTRHIEIELEDYYRALNPFTGQIEDVEADKIGTIRERVKAMGAKLDERRATRKTFSQCYIVGKIVLEESDAPSQTRFPMTFMTGYRDRNKGTFHGLVRYTLDPAKFANKLFSLMHHVISSNAKGGLMVEDGAAQNMRKLEEDWAKPGGITKFAQGAISQGKVQPKPAGSYPVQMDKLLDFSVSSIRDSVGVPLELLGMAEKDQPGVLEAQRIRSSLTLLSVLFDALRSYKKDSGALTAEFIREYLSDGRLIRIAGQQGAQYIPLVRDAMAMDYDLLVDEAPTARDVKERTFAVLMTLLPQALAMGLPPPKSILEYAPIPQGLKEEWQQQIAQAQQKPPPPNPEQIKMQGAMALQQAKHQHKMDEIGAEVQAEQAKEYAQAMSQGEIDDRKTRNKVVQRQAEVQADMAQSTHEHRLEARLAALEAMIERIGQSAQHRDAIQMAHTQAALRPKQQPKPLPN